MSDDRALAFAQIGIRKMHGFRPPGLRIEEFSPGINVVYGPNASGKSTLAQALYRLIWPESADGDEQLTGVFDVAGSRWRVELDAGRVVYQCDGRDAEAPELPARDRNGRYHLYLQDLLQADNREFARTVQREARGGYDIGEAAERLDFREPSPRTGASTRAVEEAADRVESLQARRDELRREERDLETLTRKLEAAREANSRASLLEEVQTFVEYRRERRTAERTLEEFPDVMERVDGHERERLDELDRRLEQLRADESEARRRKERAEEQLEETPFSDEGPPDGLLPTMQDRLQHVRDHARRIEQLRDELAGARSAAESVWRRLDGAVDREAARDLELSDIEDLVDYVRSTQRVDARLEFLERTREAFADAEAPSDVRLDRLREGLRHLRRWHALNAVSAFETRRRVRRTVGLSAAAILGVSCLLAVVVHPGWIGLSVVSALLGLAAYRLTGESGVQSRRDRRRRDFEKLDLEGPDDWTDAAVEERAETIARRLPRLRAQQRKAEIWADLESEYASQRDERDSLEQRGQKLAERTGLEPDTDPTTFAYFVERLREWQSARQRVVDCEAQLDERKTQRDEHLAAIAGDLRPYADSEVEDLPEAERLVHSLQKAHEQFREANRELERASEDLESIGEELESLRDEREQLYDRLEVDDAVELAALCEQREAYREARAELRELESACARKRDELREHEGFEPAMLERSRAEIDEELTELRSRAEGLEELRERKTRLENDLDRARRSRDLEVALAEYRDARNTLRRERHSDFRRAAGAVLANHLRQKTRDRQLPDVFHRARELFSEITRGRYRLLLGDGEPAEFRARDETLERGFGLDELSEGTRVQLLLSVRVAFLESREERCRLPVVLDETLATTDDVRAPAVLRAIERIARRGRQIFYLTAQRDEVAKWREYLGDCDVSRRFVRMRDVGRDGTGAAEQWRPSVDSPVPAEMDSVPLADGHTHREYRLVLEVPEWSPRQPVGSVHLWYVIDDPERLHRCLEAGLTRWGQLRHLRECGGLEAVDLDESTVRRARALAEALEAYREAWSVGRGRPVDREVLRASGAVTDNFIDEVSALCDRVDGDARRIVEGLEEGEVSGFRSNKREELEAFFRAEGYLSERQPLSNDRIWQRVLAASSDPLEEDVLERQDLSALFERVAGVRPEPTPAPAEG